MNNIKYTSPEIQNDIIKIIASSVRREIVGEISSARFFSLLVDETKDPSKTEHISFCLRYVLNDEPHEELLNFIPADELNAQSLFADIVEILSKEGVDTYELMTDKVPACFYIHCNAHKINLCIVDCVKVLVRCLISSKFSRDCTYSQAVLLFTIYFYIA